MEEFACESRAYRQQHSHRDQWNPEYRCRREQGDAQDGGRRAEETREQDERFEEPLVRHRSGFRHVRDKSSSRSYLDTASRSGRTFKYAPLLFEFDVTRDYYARARRLRDSNAALALVVAGAAVALTPLLSAFSEDAPVSAGEATLTLAWWTGATVLTGYGVIHVLAAVADTRRFIDDHGTEYASKSAVFCHALGQRLFALVGVGFALVFLAITGPGVGVPFAVLVVLGLLGAAFLGPPVAIPMNRRVSERLTEYRDA